LHAERARDRAGRGGALGWVLVSANRLAESYRPDIERAASSALGAPVHLGKLRVALLPSAHVAVSEVTVGDGGFSLANVRLSLRLLPLLRGALAIDTLTLEKPHLTLVRNARGVGLIGLPRSGARPAAPRGTPGTSAAGTMVPPALALDLRRFELRHGTVELRDDVRKSTLELDDLAVDAALAVDASGITLPRFHTTATLAGGGPMTVDGQGLTFDLGTGTVQVPALTVEVAKSRIVVKGRVETATGAGSAAISSDRLDLEQAAPLMALVTPGIARLGLRGTVALDLKGELSSGWAPRAGGSILLTDLALDAGTIAVRKLHGRLDLAATPTGATVASRDLALEAGGMPIAVTLASELAGDTATLKELVATGLGGTTRVTGTYGAATRRFTADVGADGLDLAAMQHAKDPRTPPRVTGTVARFHSQIAGTADEHPERSVTGTGNVLLKDARVLGVNVTGEVVKKIRSVPLLSAIRMPADVKSATDSSDTVITSLTADFTIGGAALHLQRAVVTSPSFSFDGGGRVGFDSNLDLQGTFRLSAAISQAMVSGVKQLALALGSGGEISVPLTIQGTPPKVAVLPDVTHLLGSGLENAAGGLLKGIGKFFKGR